MTFVVSHLWLIYALACGAIWLYVGKRRRWALRLSDVSIGRSMPTLMPAGAWVVSMPPAGPWMSGRCAFYRIDVDAYMLEHRHRVRGGGSSTKCGWPKGTWESTRGCAWPMCVLTARFPITLPDLRLTVQQFLHWSDFHILLRR